MKAFDDVVLRKMYREYDVPCDALVSDQTQLSAFATDYTARTGQATQASELAHRLLALRKRGEAKGGLPRLRRRYNGRN